MSERERPTVKNLRELNVNPAQDAVFSMLSALGQLRQIDPKKDSAVKESLEDSAKASARRFLDTSDKEQLQARGILDNISKSPLGKTGVTSQIEDLIKLAQEEKNTNGRS